MHSISESVLMLVTENYQNQSMLSDLSPCQSWRVLFRLSVLILVDSRSASAAVL